MKMVHCKRFSNDDLRCIKSGTKFDFNQDRMMAAEILSLREQLAELKALEPFGYIDSVHTDNWNYINLKDETSTVAFISRTPDGIMRKGCAMPLFTAAKPAED